MLQVHNCLKCKREFLPNRCQEHCTNACCLRAECLNARRDYRVSPSGKPCLVCRRARKDFERFAPCALHDRATCDNVDQEKCHVHCQGMFWHNSYVYFAGTVGRGWQSQCHLDSYADRINEVDDRPMHRPGQAPRRHNLYCSLRCYNSVAYGHEQRRRQGVRVRNFRWKRNNTWRRILRVENGTMKHQRRLQRIRDGRTIVFGDGRTDAELKSLDAARKAAEADQDFMDIFGPLPPVGPPPRIPGEAMP